MRTNAIVRIILFSIAIFILVCILLTGLGVGMFMHTGNIHSETTSDTQRIDGDLGTTITADASKVRKLEIEWAAGTITIVPSGDSAGITVSESAVSEEKDQMVCRQSGDTLSIQYCKDSITFPSLGVNVDFAKDLVITVPAEWVCDSLEIDAAAANVEIQNMTIGELEFDGASGTCTLENCSVGAMDLDAASGDVKFSGTLDTLDFDGASASCTLVLSNCPQRIDLDGMSGDLDITLPEDCGFTVTMNAMSSDFSSDFETVTTNGAHVHGDGSCRINIDAMSGDVIIRKGQSHHF